MQHSVWVKDFVVLSSQDSNEPFSIVPPPPGDDGRNALSLPTIESRPAKLMRIEAFDGGSYQSLEVGGGWLCDYDGRGVIGWWPTGYGRNRYIKWDNNMEL